MVLEYTADICQTRSPNTIALPLLMLKVFSAMLSERSMYVM